MVTRDALHRLVDEVPETVLPEAARALGALHAPADDQTDLSAADVRKLGGGSGERRLQVWRKRVIVELDTPAGAIHVTRVLPRVRAYRD